MTPPARIQAACASSRAPAYRDAVNEILAQVPHHVGFTVGFLFVSDLFSNDARAIVESLQESLRLRHVSGGVGLGICTNQEVIFDGPAISLLLLKVPEHQVASFRAPRGHPEEADLTGPSGEKHPVAFLHSDSQLAHHLLGRPESEDVFWVGGLTASRGASIQFHQGGTEEGGATGLMFSEDVPVLTSVSQGCQAVGPRHEITKSQGQVIISLDNQPALQVLRNDLAKLGKLPRGAGPLFVGLQLPHRDDGAYIVRNVVALDERQEMFAIGHECSPGLSIFLARRDHEAARDDLLRMLHDLEARQSKPPVAGIYYTCVARGGETFGGQDEVAVIRSILGEFPLAGVHSDGEICHGHVYTYTGILTLFY